MIDSLKNLNFRHREYVGEYLIFYRNRELLIRCPLCHAIYRCVCRSIFEPRLKIKLIRTNKCRKVESTKIKVEEDDKGTFPTNRTYTRQISKSNFLFQLTYSHLTETKIEERKKERRKGEKGEKERERKIDISRISNNRYPPRRSRYNFTGNILIFCAGKLPLGKHSTIPAGRRTYVRTRWQEKFSVKTQGWDGSRVVDKYVEGRDWSIDTPISI